MALNIKNTISIEGGEPLLFNDLFLSQQVHAHNHFEVSINWEQFTDEGMVV